MDQELAAMAAVAKAFETLSDEQARARVLAWTNARFGGPHGQAATAKSQSLVSPLKGAAVAETEGGMADLADVVEYEEDGRIRIIARDIKAKSRNDAAIRLTHIAIFASELATGQRDVSSRAIVVPILKEWRAYDANTRVALAHHPGIKRNGDLLSLDMHSRRDAHRFIQEIRDETTKGEWKAAGGNRKRRKNGTKLSND